ncbi:MAG: radical SAM protein [Planctomycetes bacterium]|nr:radical SAM protein [Planctomycetota bacterium]
MMKRIIAIIKASTLSQHFPNRYDARVQDKSILDILLERLRKVQKLDEILFSTSDQNEDDKLTKWADENGLKTSRAAYGDVVGRMYAAALLGEAAIVVNVEGNYPLIMPHEMDNLINAHLEQGVVYSTNQHYDGVMLGAGCEVANMEALEKLQVESSGYLRKTGLFALRDILPPEKILRLAHPLSRPHYRVNMAVENDLVLLEQLLDVPDNDCYENLVSFLDHHPSLAQFSQRSLAQVKEVGLEKIMLFPEKLKSLGGITPGHPDPEYPISVELSLTNRCNLSCPWCSDSNLRQQAMVDLSYETLQELVRDLKAHGTKGIVIEGGGEPTLYKHFNELVEFIAAQGLSIGLITNGVLFPYRDLVKHFSWIRISLDASSKENYRECKGKDLFDQVLNNIHSIAEEGIVCGVGYVVNKLNSKNLEDLVLTLRRLNTSYVHFRPVVDHEELFEPLDLTYLQKYTTDRFNVLVDAMRENRICGNDGKPCRAHSLSTVITADGNVYLCGRLNIHPDWKPIGNLYQNSFHEIWLGQERREQADQMLDGEFCRSICPECRITKYNILLENMSKVKTVNFI